MSRWFHFRSLGKHGLLCCAFENALLVFLSCVRPRQHCMPLIYPIQPKDPDFRTLSHARTLKAWSSRFWAVFWSKAGIITPPIEASPDASQSCWCHDVGCWLLGFFQLCCLKPTFLDSLSGFADKDQHIVESAQRKAANSDAQGPFHAKTLGVHLQGCRGIRKSSS